MLSLAALMFSLSVGYRDVTRQAPTVATLEMAAAQVRLEGLDEVRGCGKRGYNFGGLTVRNGCRRGANPIRIAIYPSRRDAARAYWRVVLKCRGAREAFAARDVPGATARLKACRYMGENVVTYRELWSRLLRRKR